MKMLLMICVMFSIMFTIEARPPAGPAVRRGPVPRACPPPPPAPGYRGWDGPRNEGLYEAAAITSIVANGTTIMKNMQPQQTVVQQPVVVQQAQPVVVQQPSSPQVIVVENNAATGTARTVVAQ